jgi:hypothetical protein
MNFAKVNVQLRNRIQTLKFRILRIHNNKFKGHLFIE